MANIWNCCWKQNQGLRRHDAGESADLKNECIRGWWKMAVSLLSFLSFVPPFMFSLKFLPFSPLLELYVKFFCYFTFFVLLAINMEPSPPHPPFMYIYVPKRNSSHYNYCVPEATRNHHISWNTRSLWPSVYDYFAPFETPHLTFWLVKKKGTPASTSPQFHHPPASDASDVSACVVLSWSRLDCDRCDLEQTWRNSMIPQKTEIPNITLSKTQEEELLFWLFMLLFFVIFLDDDLLPPNWSWLWSQL